MKKLFYAFGVLLLVGNILVGCDNEYKVPGVFGNTYLNVVISDSLGTPDLVDPSLTEYSVDSLGRQHSYDSIIIPKDKNVMYFDISTNCQWKASRENKAGLNGWMSIPSKAMGGGDSDFTASVVRNATKNDKKVYFYVVTSDSSFIRKYVIVQPHP
ncbi:hypothetical protein [Bacteroides sp.]